VARERTAMLNTKNVAFCPHSACMCYVSFLQQTVFFPCTHSPTSLSNGKTHCFL